MPLLNFRALAPDHLIDLNRVEELSYLRIEEHCIESGAMTRQRTLERSREVGARLPVLQQALDHVGHRQTRNRGTLGGSLCHLDPSAELANVAALLGGTLHAVSQRGRREIPFVDFPAGYLATSLAADELLAAVTLPLPAPAHGHAFVEFARRHGDFALVACSALVTLDARGEIATAAIALSGLGPAPLRPAAIERALIGHRPAAPAFKDAAAEAGRLEAHDDPFVSAAYRRHLARILTFRALEQAGARALEHLHG
jgi:aerobic carbon-monoxide dehydrogenase medium subunit